MTGQFSIRFADMDDIPLIRSLADISFRDTYRQILSPEQLEFMMDWMYSESSLQTQMNRDGHVFFIAQIDGEPVGYVSVQKEDSQDEEKELFHLQKLYILPSFKGQGIGKAMFDYVSDYVRNICPLSCQLRLNVNRNNPAVEFYKKMGMTKILEGDFPIGKGFYMNDYIMAKDLK